MFLALVGDIDGMLKSGRSHQDITHMFVEYYFEALNMVFWSSSCFSVCLFFVYLFFVCLFFVESEIRTFVQQDGAGKNTCCFQ